MTRAVTHLLFLHFLSSPPLRVIMDSFHFCVDSSYITVTWLAPTVFNDLQEKKKTVFAGFKSCFQSKPNKIPSSGIFACFFSLRPTSVICLLPHKNLQKDLETCLTHFGIAQLSSGQNSPSYSVISIRNINEIKVQYLPSPPLYWSSHFSPIFHKEL